MIENLVGLLPVDFGDVAQSVLDLADEVGEYSEPWQRMEVGIMRGICWIFNDSPWIYFEPQIERATGEIEGNGYGCPAEGKNRGASIGGSNYPDFYISSGEPKDNKNGLILGEIKASVRIAYNTWIRPKTPGSRHFRPEQLEAFSRHTAKFIKPRLMLLVTFNDGPDAMKVAILNGMQQNGIVAGIILALK